MVRCKRCGKVVKHPQSVSWESLICPQCYHGISVKKYGGEPDVETTKGYNPVDKFWDSLTDMYLRDIEK